MNGFTIIYRSIMLFLVFLIFIDMLENRKKSSKSEYKYIDLPEEFNQIQSGDTIDVFTISDTTYIRFIPPNSNFHSNKTIVKI